MGTGRKSGVMESYSSSSEGRSAVSVAFILVQGLALARQAARVLASLRAATRQSSRVSQTPAARLHSGLMLLLTRKRLSGSY